MDRDSFSLWWDTLPTLLKPGTEIPHWSAQGQYQEESFKVLTVESKGILIDISRPTLPAPNRPIIEHYRGTLEEFLLGMPGELIPTNREHYLGRARFLNARRHWHDYCGGTVSRTTMAAKIGGGASTYVISIMKWVQDHEA
jgi:hypothetical protein